MKKDILSGALALLFICFSLSSYVFAESNTEKYLGKRVQCLQTINFSGSYILDDQTILFETVHGVVFINRLPSPCHGLKVSDGFAYNTAIKKLCKQDIIRLVENSYGLTNSCGLGEFFEMNGPKKIDQAIKILKDDGILEILVKEGAFNNKEAHP